MLDILVCIGMVADLFKHFNVCTVKCTDCKRTVKHKLHVTCTRSFLTRC